MAGKDNTILVRIGEIAYARKGCLTCLAIGSCIALALLNERTGQAAMAHIFLPQAPAKPVSPGKYADTAVIEMLQHLRGQLKPSDCLGAYVVGGARMFPQGFCVDGSDIGQLNSKAVLSLLDEYQIPIRFSDLGGTKARNVRFQVQERSIKIQLGTKQP